VRWFWIDRFTEFVSGKRATAIKAVTLAEEQLDEYIPGFPVMPASLIVEGFAQAGGLLIGAHYEFKERVVLAKVSKAVFHCEARPGDVLTYRAEVTDLRPDGGMVFGTSHIGDRLQAEVEMVLAILGDRFAGVDLFYPADFLCILRLLGMFDVGQTPDGNPLPVPPHMLEAEELANRSGLN
jgi:3-hydroxyacyl-[acyl-carrier-protein] dehydratase